MVLVLVKIIQSIFNDLLAFSAPLKNITIFFPALYEKAEIKPPEDKKKHLLIGVSSDRGLCGAIHTSIAKTLKNEITNLSNAGKEVMVVGVGDKIRGLLQR